MNPEDLLPRKRYAGFEGGAVYTAERDGHFYVILDEDAMRSLLSEEDLEGLVLTKALEFETVEERAAYLKRRFGPNHE